MYASEIPHVDATPFWFVRGQNTWGKADNLPEAIRNAEVYPQQTVHVCKVDPAASADSIDGSLLYNARGDIWSGYVRANRKDIRLKAITHPAVQTKAIADGNL